MVETNRSAVAAVAILSFALPMPSAALRAVAVVAALFLVHRHLSRSFRLEWPLFVLLSCVLVSVPLSIEPGRSVVQFATLLVLATVSSAIASVLSVREIARALTLGLLAQVGIGLLAQNLWQSDSSYAGFHGLLSNPNVMAFVIVVAIVGVVDALSCAGRLTTLSGLSFLLALLFVLLVRTNSDGGFNYAALGVGIFGLLVVFRRSGLELTAIVLTGLAFLAIVFGRKSVDYLASLTGVSDNPSLSGRLDIWPAALTAIRERPWTGWGVGTTSSSTAEFGVPEVMNAWSEVGLASFHAHNGFLDVGVQAGVFALIAALWVFAALIISGARGFSQAAPGATWRLVLIVVLLAYNMTEVRFLDPPLAFFVVSLLLYASAMPTSSDRTEGRSHLPKKAKRQR